MFKGSANCKLDATVIIATNYLLCVILGIANESVSAHAGINFSEPWIWWAVAHGPLLVLNFFLLARSTDKAGIAITSLASRLSVGIPVILGIWLFSDTLSLIRGAGLILAGISLWLAIGVSKVTTQSISERLLPPLVFIFYGVHFTILKYVQSKFLGETDLHLYSAAIFFVALFVTLFIIGFRTNSMRERVSSQALVLGALLGICNYGVVYFLLAALASPTLSPAFTYPTYSVGVVLLSTMLGFLLFKEELTRRKLVGMSVGVISILLLSL